MDKKMLRAEALALRKGLTEEYMRLADGAIRRELLRLPEYRAAKRVFLYVSMPGEPDTRTLLEDAWAAGKEVYVPLCLGKGVMRAVRVRALSDLAPGALGIPEPVEAGECAAPETLDLCAVPCLMAGRDGGRLGHGAGYYDRFLRGSGLRTACLCYERLVRENLPMEETDVPMDVLLTEEGTFPVSKRRQTGKDFVT